MSLIAVEGFDHYGTASGDPSIVERTGVLAWSGSSPASYTTGRFGQGQSANINGNLEGTYLNDLVTAVVGFAFKGGNTVGLILTFNVMNEGAAGYTNPIQFALQFNAANCSFNLFRGQGTSETQPFLASGPNNCYVNNVWNYFEIYYTVSTTSGSFEIRCNDVLVWSVSGLNLSGTGTSTSSGFRLDAQPNTLIDDLYVCDTTTGPGTYPCNNFLGDIYIRTLFATANESVSWTPLSGTNYQMVDEVDCDGDTTYNYTTGVNNIDLFAIGSAPSTATAIFGVAVTGCYRKDDAGARTVSQEISSSGTASVGTAFSLNAGYQFYQDMFPVDPATSASWTLSGVDNLQVGYKLVS